MSWVLLSLAWVVSVTSLEFDSHGQDVTVRDDSGKVVFFSGVPDTSHGSDTDTDLTGDEEFFQACMWTFRQKLELCDGSQCGEAELMAHDLQREMLRFYDNPAHPPPLEDVAWLVFGSRANDRKEMFGSCPGLVVTALLLMTEALAFAAAPMAQTFAQEAATYIAAAQRHPPMFNSMVSMFPIMPAYQSTSQALDISSQSSSQEAHGQPSIDLVIARCRSPLQWLWELDLPPGARVFVYEKCGASDTDEQTRGIQGLAQVIRRDVADGEGSPMTGECTAYASHAQLVLSTASAADYTVFLHDDAPRHIRMALLALALRSIRGGARVPFMHLTHERYPAFRTPCFEKVYEDIFGEAMPGLVSTYCCAHFIVSRERLQARSAAFFERLQALVGEARYSTERGGSCVVKTKPCYVVEFFWHHIFGEPLNLPLRVENPALPLGLRFDGGRFSRRPSPLTVSPYMAYFKPTRYSDQLRSG